MLADDAVRWADQDREPLQVFQEICTAFKVSVPERIEAWKQHDLLKPHARFLDSARDAYLADNYIGAIQVLFPRIEGVMRSLHLLKTPSGKLNQQTMVRTLADQLDADSVLLPRRFQEYLLNFYFQSFDERSGDIPLSRHSVAHGNARAEDYDFIKATLGFFILDQMFFYLRP